MSDPRKSAPRRRLPPWLRKRLTMTGPAAEVQRMLDELGLETVCANAHCPNQAECYARRTATFMILGARCTRTCRYCAVAHADAPLPPPDPDEPRAVAEASHRLGLRHVVVTSVTRDDLPDGGAAHFAATIRAVRDRLPEAVIEVLTPDFGGDRDPLGVVLDAEPTVFNHNLETVRRLFPVVRPEADYRRSLNLLAAASRTAPGVHTKSGLMVGLGETDDEVSEAICDLRGVGCDVLTIGQYLAPSDAHEPVRRFVTPERFDAWRDEAKAAGFRAVASGPFVRSSYRADRVFEERSDPPAC